MSTKIYNGYRIRTLNGVELQEFISELRTLLSEKMEEKYLKSLAVIGQNMINKLVMLNAAGDKEALTNYLKEIYFEYHEPIVKRATGAATSEKNFLEEVIKMKYLGSTVALSRQFIENECKLSEMNQFTTVSLKSDLCVFPRDEKYTLLTVYGLLEDLFGEIIRSRKAKFRNFKKKYGLEEYGYWNNTDKPDNISNKVWDKREADWDFLDIPSTSGMSIDVYPYEVFLREHFFSANAKLEDFLQPKEHFVKRYGYEKAKEVYLKKNVENGASASDVTKHCREFKKLVDNKDPKALEVIKYWEKYYDKILPEISKETLLKSVSEFIPKYLNGKGDF